MNEMVNSPLGGEAVSATSASWHNDLKIQTHPVAGIFPLLPPDELQALAEDIKTHGLRERIKFVRGSDGAVVIVDGRNRCDALELVGMDRAAEVAAREYFEEVKLGDDAAIVDYVMSANARRRHLTSEQKRHVAAELLKLFPERPNIAIAKLIGISDHTVASVRANLEARSQIASVDKRPDTMGRQQVAHPARPRQSQRPTESQRESERRAMRTGAEAAGIQLPVTATVSPAPAQEPTPASKPTPSTPAQPDMFQPPKQAVAAPGEVEPRIEYARKAIAGLKSLSTMPDVTAFLIEAFVGELGSRDIVNLPSNAKSRLLRFCEQTLARFSEETLAIASDLPIDLERSRNAGIGAESAAVGLEALLAPWIELKHRYAERRAAIEAAVQKETGVSAEDDVKYRAQSLARAFGGGGESSPDAQRYFALRRQIEKRFPPEIGDDEWERVTAPLDVVIDQITSVRPETFVGLGVQARAIHYIFWDSDLHPSEEDCSKVRQFLADAMMLAGLPGPMVASSDLDADIVAFTKLFTDKLAAKIEKSDHDWCENKKDGQVRGSPPSWEIENRRKWAEEALRETKSGLARLIGPKKEAGP